MLTSRRNFQKGLKDKLIPLKSQVEQQIQLFQKCMKHSETVTFASYQLAWNIAQAKQPYNERRSEKKVCKKNACDWGIVEILSPETNKLKPMVFKYLNVVF